MAAQQHMEVVVPPGTRPGQTISFTTPHGSTMQAMIPGGCMPGSTCWVDMGQRPTSTQPCTPLPPQSPVHMPAPVQPQAAYSTSSPKSNGGARAKSIGIVAGTRSQDMQVCKTKQPMPQTSPLPSGSATERQVRVLEGQLKAAQEALETRASVQEEVTALKEERNALRLQVEMQQLSQNGETGATDVAGLHIMREKIRALEAERKEQKAQHEEAQRRVKALEEQCADLQNQLMVNEQRRRSSHWNVSRSLSDLSDKLATVEASWTPWTDINEAKQKLGEVQKQHLAEVDASVEKVDLAYGA